MPVWKGWKHLREGPGLVRRRDTALWRTAAALVVLAALLGAVPAPFHSVHQAVVWLPDEALVRAEASGAVSAAGPAPGSAVQPGQVLLRLDDPRQTAELAVAAAAVAQAEAQLRQAEVDEPARAGPLRAELAARRARLAESERRQQALTVAAAAGGRWVPAAATELPGRFVKRGEVLGYVVGGPSARVRTAVAQEDLDLIRSRLQAVQVRLGQDLAAVVPAEVRRQVPGGEYELVSAALGTSGGGEIAVDPQQPGGTKALRRVFDIELQLARPPEAAVFGDRAWVRFDLGHAPLAWQGWLRLRQVFLSTLGL